ncbi:MAG: hypothetical protein M3340_08520 [Actinomycetota bacterium]|nr:hypothetical protein [Actinomycetota bacterium]
MIGRHSTQMAWAHRRWSGRRRGPAQAQLGDLVVSFFADGPYHANVRETLAFPDGYSFHRPFRYRDEYIDEPVRVALAEHGSHVHGLPAVLAMRFESDQATRRLLPVREIELIHAAIRAGTNEIFFRLGRFLEVPEGTKRLADLCVTLDEAVPASQFMFRMPGARTARPPAPDEDFTSWTRLIELIAQDRETPIAEEARDSVFVRFQRPRRARPDDAKAVYWSWQQGWRYGGRMREGREAELAFLHRVPSTKSATVKSFPLEYETTTADLTMTPKQEEISGNYQSHVAVLQPAVAQSPLTEIHVKGPDDVEVSGAGKVYGSDYRLPMRVAFGFWHRLTHTVVPMVLVAAALAANALIAAYDKFKDEPDLLIWIAVASLFASGVLYVYKR